MKGRRRWPWVIIFILVCLLSVTLGVLWNMDLVHNYELMNKVIKDFESPWPRVIFGSLAYLLLLLLLLVIFLKIFREMKLNQLQKEFLARVTHELKTPLATLELCSTLLWKNEELPHEERLQLWITHQNELKRLSLEIELLLETTRWEFIQEKPQLAHVSLSELLNDIILRWKSILDSDFEISQSGDKLPSIVSDARLLTLIINNILDNARKFSLHAKDKKIIIHTELNLDEHAWKIKIQDFGLGFDPKFSKKIFKRFFRAPHLNQVAIPGTGVGLALVTNTCKVLNIEISAESKGSGLGAVFILKGRY